MRRAVRCTPVFGYPHIFLTIALDFATPIGAALLCWVYTARSGHREPLWVTLPGYIVLHAFSLCLGYSWNDMAVYSRWEWTYYTSPVVSGLCLVLVIWLGIRKAREPPARGFEIGLPRY